MLQGCGPLTWQKYKMGEVNPRLMRDFIGNGRRPQHVMIGHAG